MATSDVKPVPPRADARSVKWLLSGVAGVALLGLAFVRGVIPGTDGCVLRSVDKADYVAKNEAVFSTIRLPRHLREADTNTYSVGIPSPRACLPRENSPPYDAYVTWHVFIQPRGQYPRGFDRTSLGPEWVSQGGAGHEESFRRGDASLYVTFSDEATSFAVDHRAYAKSG
jgi:hypothetical protein